jgi:exopolyphosphatase/guanosine-5'-triphosphate,3'-diphosphate pyrophosphatase
VPRFASIDIGTNSVLLLVAERGTDGRFVPVLERAEITRLGRGVDRTRTLAAEAIEDTVAVLERYAAEAREAGATQIVATATSAARDCSNGGEFLSAVLRRAGVKVEIISGDEEARLSFASAFADFGREGPLVVIDIGGGSTELIFGDAAGAITYRRSFDVGSVRLTERWVTSDPVSPIERARLTGHLDQTFSALPIPAAGFQLVGVAGTVTTVCAVARAIEPYDPAQIHGARLTLAEVAAVVERLCTVPLAHRRTLPGLQPKRADVIPAGALILEAAARRLGAAGVRVSDHGLRWGLLADRFGAS